MIYDSIKSCEQYGSLHPLLKEAFEFLKKAHELQPGRYELSQGMYANIAAPGMTRNGEDALFEAHRKYIDVQMLLMGRSRVEWALTEDLEVEVPYQAEKDYIGLKGSGRFFEARPDEFYILYPNDAHKPHCLYADQSEPFQVAVVKIPLE